MKKSVRLPSHIKPAHYEITVRPDMEAFTFEGKEDIRLTISKASRVITMHSKELQVESVVFRQANSLLAAAKISYDVDAETVSLTFKKPLPKGKGILSLQFRGVLSDKLYGYYRSRYTINGEEKFLATTQFEPTSARRAFPCFDEPSHKAVFKVHMIVPVHHEAISNTLPARVSEHEAGYKMVSFEPSPKMSTYLLAFISGELESIERKTKSGVLVRVFTTPGKKHQGVFALDTAVKVLDFYEKYFAITYPLKTLDMIAIPDFASGAMENWGAVTYRESQFLVDPVHSSAVTKQWAAITIAHELAHQWFGNLVTMEWWTHLWLNESFASYIEYLAVDHLFPEWDMWTQFAYLDAGSAFALDSLNNTHPIEVEVHHPDEIDEIFDAISYQKGSSVIRMLAEYLGEKNFRDGLRYYLAKHAYKNATTNDLWYAFERVSKKPVRKIMNAWTANTGHPAITVEDTGRELKLTQSRFYSSEVSRTQSKDKSLWPIPLGVTNLETGKSTFEVFDKKSITIKKPKSSSGVKLNPGETGFYRVDYPEKYISDFTKAMRNKKFSARDRLGVMSNLFALSESGQFTTSAALLLLESYREETDYTVWLELISNLKAVEALTIGEAFENEYRTFARKILSIIAKKLGWDKNPKESHGMTMLRGTVLYNYGHFGDKPTIARAKRYFREYMSGKRKIAPDFRGFIYQTAVENGGDREYKLLLERYKSEELNEERNRIGRALGSFRSKRLIQKSLLLTLSKHVRTQEFYYIFGPAFVNPYGAELAWDFMRSNWDEFVARFGQGHQMSRLVQLPEIFNTKAKAKEVEKFFKSHPTPGADRAVQQALEKIHSNIAWKSRIKKDFRGWFASK